MLDGTYVWVYTPSTTPGQVIRMTIPTDPVYGPNVLARILDKPAERYETTLLRTDVVDGRPVDVVEFMPNGGDPLFRRAVIWLDRETFLPRRLELDELTRVRRTLTLSKIRTNTQVNRREFAFDSLPASGGLPGRGTPSPTPRRAGVAAPHRHRSLIRRRVIPGGGAPSRSAVSSRAAVVIAAARRSAPGWSGSGRAAWASRAVGPRRPGGTAARRIVGLEAPRARERPFLSVSESARTRLSKMPPLPRCGAGWR
jgi:hypothetical protein